MTREKGEECIGRGYKQGCGRAVEKKRTVVLPEYCQWSHRGTELNNGTVVDYPGTHDGSDVVPPNDFIEVVVWRVLETANVFPAVKVAVAVYVRAGFSGAGARGLVNGRRGLGGRGLIHGGGGVRGSIAFNISEQKQRANCVKL